MMDNVTEGDAPTLEQTDAVEAKADNLTSNELVAKLLERRTGKAEQAEEELPPTEPPVEVEEPEAPPETVGETPEVEPESQTLPEDGKDVLSKYGINLDELPPDEAEAIAKQLGSRAVKRFGKLTGQKKELQERLETLESHYQEALEAKEASAPQAKPDPDNPLSHINTEKGLTDEVSNTHQLIDWIGDQLDNEPQYDDEGNEYLAELNGNKFGKKELKDIRTNARKTLREEIPKRRNWIEQRTQFDGMANQAFTWLDNEEDPKTQFFNQIKANTEYSGLVNGVSAGNFAVGLMSIGWEVFLEQSEAKEAKPKSTPGNPPPAATPQAPPPKQVQGRMTDQKKAIQAAELKFQQSGNPNDLTALRRLKAQARGVQ